MKTRLVKKPEPVKPKRKYVRKAKPTPPPKVKKTMAHEPVKAVNKLTPYPQTLDTMAFLADAVAFFRGNGDKAKIVHDAYEALGYGLGKYIPDEVTGEFPVRFASPQTFAAMGNSEAASFIEQQVALKGLVAGEHRLLDLVIQAALKIIAQWLGFQ